MKGLSNPCRAESKTLNTPDVWVKKGTFCYPQRGMVEAVVCTSYPESYHDRVAEFCLQHQVQKAFGKAGDMVNAQSGKDWIPEWEAKVVLAPVAKAQTLNSDKALTLGIAGGKHCDAEMARQPTLVRAIKTEVVQGRPSLAKPESRCINRLKNGPAYGSFD